MFTAELYLVNNSRSFSNYAEAVDWAKRSGFHWRITDETGAILSTGWM